MSVRLEAQHMPIGSVMRQPRKVFGRFTSLGTIALLAVAWFSPCVRAAAPVVTTITPNSAVYRTVPQETITITGTGLVTGIPSTTNRPTLTLRHTSMVGVEYSMQGTVNFGGTTSEFKPGTNSFNLINAPMGAYDLIVSRPDGQSVTVPGGFVIGEAPELAPGKLDFMAAWGGKVKGIDVVGDTAYIAAGRRLVLLNVANKHNPVELGSITLVGVNDVRVRDGFAYVAAEQPHYFCVIDVRNPAEPVVVWYHHIGPATPEDARAEVELMGNLAFTCSHNQHWVGVYDITDPYNVVVKPSIINYANTIDVDGQYLYVGEHGAADTPALSIYHVDPSSGAITRIGDIPGTIFEEGDFDTIYSVCVKNGYAYLGGKEQTFNAPLGEYGGVLVVADVSSPAQPVVLNIDQDSYDFPLDVSVSSNGTVCVADGAPHPQHPFWSDSRGLVISQPGADPGDRFQLGVIPEPGELIFASQYKSFGGVNRVTVVGTTAYLTDMAEGLIIMDITNPLAPQRLGSWESPAAMRDIRKSGDLLYVVDAYGGFTVLDVSDSAHPQPVGRYLANRFNNLCVDASGLELVGSVAYLGAGCLGIEAVDISDPTHPQFLRAKRVPAHLVPGYSFYGDIDVKDSFVIATMRADIPTAFWDEVQSVDMESSTPTILDTFVVSVWAEPSLPQRLTISGNLAVLTQNGAILDVGNVFDLQGVFAPPSSSDPLNRSVENHLAGPLLVTAQRWGANNSPSELNNQRGAYVVDVSNPQSPVELARYTSAVEITGADQPISSGLAVEVRGNLMYVMGWGGGNWRGTLFILDITDPLRPVCVDYARRLGAPQFAAVCPTAESVYVTTGGTSAYSLGAAGLVIFDVTAVPPPACSGDANGDSAVNGADLSVLLAQFNQKVPAGSGADFNGDGFVNGADLSVLLGAFGDTCD